MSVQAVSGLSVRLWYTASTPRGGTTASRRTTRPDPLHAWLAKKVDGALEDEEPTDRSWALDSGSPGEATVELDEAVDDPETVLGSSIARQAWLELEQEEEEDDDATVQRSQMPVSFIGEAVMDDNTVADQRLPPGWRQMLQDDESRASKPPAPRAAAQRPAAPVDLAEDDEGVPIAVWVIAGLLVAGAALVAVFLLL